MATPGEPFDLGYSGWVADYPDPIQMLNPLIEDSSIAPTLDNPAYLRRLIESSDDFFSARIGCQSFGIYGTDLAALCVQRTH
jgi:hypothetical protein